MTRKPIIILITVLCSTLLFLLYKMKNDDQFMEGLFKQNNLKGQFFNDHFKYVINNDGICESKDRDVLAIIIVTSYFSNIGTRSAMRKAFTTAMLHKLNLRRVFLLGVAPEHEEKTQATIEEENKQFGDLIQGNFVEAYKNLTYKHLMGLRWASTYCNNAVYVIKMDDDIVTNLYKVTELLKVLNLPPETIAGYILDEMIPIRIPTNKWYVTQEEYSKSIYPKFVSGWFYVTKPSICKQLINISKFVEYFWIDDIYVTGILAEKLKLNFYNIGNYFTVFPEILMCCERDLRKYNYDCEVLVGPNGGDDNFFYRFNLVLSKCYRKPCLKRPHSLNNTCVGEKKFPLRKGSSIIEKLQLLR